MIRTQELLNKQGGPHVYSTPKFKRVKKKTFFCACIGPPPIKIRCITSYNAETSVEHIYFQENPSAYQDMHNCYVAL